VNRFDIALGKTPTSEETAPSVFKAIDRLNDHAIPKTLDEAVDALGDLMMATMSDQVAHVTLWTEIRSRVIIGEMTEEQFLGRFHHSMGHYIRNEWGLWEDSDLAKHFKAMGIWHPDDMSGIILASLYRKITEKERDLKAQIRHYREYWAEHGEPGMCAFTGKKCSSINLDDGSHGVSSDCGQGVC
jgi:hypothetical protein